MHNTLVFNYLQKVKKVVALFIVACYGINTMNAETKTETATIAPEILAGEKEIAHVLTTAQVKPLVQPHYTNLANGNNGIEALISEILIDHGAVLPLGIETTELRTTAIATSLYMEQILSEVQQRFSAGTSRYPKATVATYLSVFMTKKGIVGKIQLKGKEDPNRTSPKPRAKYFLVAK